jgi:hypothetical protein
MDKKKWLLSITGMYSRSAITNLKILIFLKCGRQKKRLSLVTHYLSRQLNFNWSTKKGYRQNWPSLKF